MLVASCGDDDSDEPTMWDAREYIRDNLPDTVGALLWENPAIRAEYERHARDEDPELWAEINADGDITYEEFRSIPDVQDSVLGYADDFTYEFQEDMGATPE